MAEEDAQLHATFSPKFSSFPRSHNATVFFSRRNINSLSFSSSVLIAFLPFLRGKVARTLPMGRFLHPFTNFTRSERSAEKSPSFKRKEKRVVKKKKKKRKGDPPNRGILDQRLAPEGNHIFRTETTVSPFFFSAVFLVPPSPPPPSLPISRYFPVSQFEREISSNVQTCFSGGFLAAHSRDGGSDCRRDPTRGLIMHKMLPVSARRLLSRTNPYGGGFRYSGVSGWRG